MTTAADEAIDRAKNHIREATKELSTVVIDKVWGSEDFSQEWKSKFCKAMLDLIKVGQDLDT